MRSPFRSKIKITQAFNARPEYYKQFGLRAHEGIDCIPTGTSWEVLALEDGVVVNETDDPRSGAYGIWLTIWHPTVSKATQYCHLKENYVSAGDKVTKGQKVGTMGTTGNSTGAHLHLNLYDVDPQGVRLNRNNGYNGGIDPLPWMESLHDEASPSIQSELDKARADRDSHWNDLMRVKSTLNLPGEYSITTLIAEIEKLMKYEDEVRIKDRQLSELNTQATELQTKFTDLSERHTQLLAKYQTLEGDFKIQGEALYSYSQELDRLQKQVNTEPKESIVNVFVKVIARIFGKG